MKNSRVSNEARRTRAHRHIYLTNRNINPLPPRSTIASRKKRTTSKSSNANVRETKKRKKNIELTASIYNIKTWPIWWWCYGLCAWCEQWCYYLFQFRLQFFCSLFIFSIICPCFFLSLSQEAAAGDHKYTHTHTHTLSWHIYLKRTIELYNICQAVVFTKCGSAKTLKTCVLCIFVYIGVRKHTYWQKG